MRSQLKPNQPVVAGKTSAKSRAPRSIGRRAVPKQRLAPPAGDPIYAAISRCIETERECFRLQDIADESSAAGDKKRMEAASDAVRGARMQLAKTAPTTLSGLATLTRFLKEQGEELDTSFFDDEMGECMPFYASLDRCLTSLVEDDPVVVFRRGLGKESKGDPIFAAIERHRIACKACDRKGGDLPDKLADREGAALRAVAKCVPTSLLGILALLDFALGERKVPYSKKPVPLMERGLYEGDLLETIRRACHSLLCEKCAELNK